MVSDKLFPNLPDMLPKCTVPDYLGWKNEFPITRAFLDCPFFRGWTDAPIDYCSVLLGNVTGATMLDSKAAFNAPNKEDLASVATRSQSCIKSKLTSVNSLMIPAVRDLNITIAEFTKLQADCPTLKDIRNYAKNGKIFVRKNNSC